MTAAPLFPGFDGLMTLSRREGVDIRPTLLRVLTDLYVQARSHSPDEERQFVELTSRLIEQVDDATRAAVRSRLAIYPGTPLKTMIQLGLRPAHPNDPVPLAVEIPAAAPAPERAVREPTASGIAPGVEPVDAAQGRRRDQRIVLCRRRSRTRADPAQSQRHAAEGLGPDSRAPRQARAAYSGNGGVRLGRGEFCARARRGADPARAHRSAKSPTMPAASRSPAP